MNGSRRDYHPVSTMRHSSISKRLIFAYIFDWIAIIIIAAIGGGLNFVKPQHRAFSLLDLNISFPYVTETISTATLILVALVAPAVIIAVIALALIPGRRFSRTTTKAQLIRVKFWELEKGLAGLALSVAVAFFVTQGLKNIFGKPRPDLLARCQPDLNNIAAHVVGGYGQGISERWTLVTSTICQQPDLSILNDGFRSFPSGHASFSWSGLLYLTLFLCSKFAITIPYLPVSFNNHTSSPLGNQADQDLLPLHHGSSSSGSQNNKDRDAIDHTNITHPSPSARTFALQNAAATPPNYLLILALVPVAVAAYICSTRFVQYYHFGFDLISGSLIGILSSWFAFRWYHLPISRGHGWAWGPRSRERAFAIAVGTDGYVDREEPWRRQNVDLDPAKPPAVTSADGNGVEAQVEAGRAV